MKEADNSDIAQKKTGTMACYWTKNKCIGDSNVIVKVAIKLVMLRQTPLLYSVD